MKDSKNIDDLRTVAHLMDERFKGPFGWRFGWDGLLGLIPGVGDMVTNSVSVYILFRALQLKCSPSVMARMGLNIFVENLVDIVPFFGNLFDFVWKANSKNLRLIEAHLQNPQAVTLKSQILVGLVLFAILASMILALSFAIYLMSVALSMLGV